MICPPHTSGTCGPEHGRPAVTSLRRERSWERALQVADALPTDMPYRMAKRIAPRTLICANTFRRFHPDISPRFEELRDLCNQVDDKASLATGMAGMTVEHVLYNRLLDASRLASEYMAVVESIGDPGLTIGLSFAGIVAKHQTGETDEVLRWAQAVIDLACENPEQGGFILDSPLATALAWRGVGRLPEGSPGWRDDFEQASAVAGQSDALSQAAIIAYKYAGIPRGVSWRTNQRCARSNQGCNSPSGRMTTWRLCCCP